MAISYSTLKQTLKDYTENDSDEFNDILDRIIENTELDIYRAIDLDVFRQTATTTLAAGNRFLKKPLDMVIDRFLSVSVNQSEVYLIGKDASFIQTYWPDVTVRGVPKYYADWDHDSFVIAPNALDAYTYTLAYTYRPPSIVTTGSTSWLGDNAPDVLLYGCLVESYGFQKTIDAQADVNFWGNKYKASLEALRLEEERRQRREEQRAGERR